MILGQLTLNSLFGRKIEQLYEIEMSRLVSNRDTESRKYECGSEIEPRDKRRHLRRDSKIKIKIVIEDEILRLCVVREEMPLTVTRGNPWSVPASIRVLSKRSSPALPLRGHPRKYDFVVVKSSTREL